MSTNKHRSGFLALCVVSAITTFNVSAQEVAVQEPVAHKPKIAIGRFDYKGPFIFDDGTEAFVDMISTALIKTRRFEMVERSRVNEALQEMGLGEAGVVDPADCQKFGSLLKADLILFGSITQASLDDKAVSVEGLTTATRVMRLAVDMRIIDAATGEIKTAETIERTKTAAKSVQVSGAISTVNASSGLVGDVMRDVANEVVNKLVQSVYPIKITLVTEDGKVKLDAGEQMVQNNQIYDVMDADGFSGGKIRITGVFSKYSTAQISEGNVEVGSICVKSQQVGPAKRAPVQEIPW